MKRASHSPRLQSGMALINKLNGFLILYRLNPNEKLFSQIAELLSPEKLTKILPDATNNSKTSNADFIRIGETYEMLADFIASKQSAIKSLDTVKTCVKTDWSNLEAFYQSMSDEDIRLFGAQIWLGISELFIASAQFKLSSQEWGQIFHPVESWFGGAGCDAVEVCLEKWRALIAFVSSKSPKDIRKSGKYIQLIQIFSKPLRSRTTINKFSNMLPVIRTYAFLIGTFKDVLDERFEELIICFLRFLAGKKAQVFATGAEIETELKKPIDFSELILNCAVPSHLGQLYSFRLIYFIHFAIGQYTDLTNSEMGPADQVCYLTDDRTYNTSDTLTLYILPVISSVLGVAYDGHPTDIPVQVPPCGNKPDLTQKYAVFLGQILRLAGRKCNHENDVTLIGSCFAALSQRISCIDEIAVKKSESRLLFMQVEAWIEENNYAVEVLEPVLCKFFTPKDMFMYANTLSEWPVKALLNSLLEKYAGVKISHLLNATCGTLSDSNVVLKRAGELSDLMEEHLQRFEIVSLMKAWTQLVDITRVFITETGDINEGGLIRPDFHTTFGLLRLIFRIANVAEEDVDQKVLQKCTNSFGQLYSEAQTGVRHEHGCSAETILKGVYDDLIIPETFSCVNVYTSAFASLIEVYPFSFINEDGVSFASSSEFRALGEITPLIKAVNTVGRKLIEMISRIDKESKLAKSIVEDVMSTITVIKKLFQSIEKPSMIRNMFLSMSDLLKDMYAFLFTEDVRFKAIASPALEAYLTVLKLVKEKASGPYDESMLSECAPLFVQLLGGMHGKRAKLRAAAAELWNSTFAKAVFNYPAELRKILINLVQKRIVFAAGLPRKSISSNDINEYREITESNSNSSLNSQSSQSTVNGCAAVDEDHARRRRSKRFAAPRNVEPEKVSTKKAREDTNGTIIVKKETEELPSSPATDKILKEEIRDSPKPSPSLQTSATKRRKFVGLLEEDSIDYVPIGTSDSAKKMKLTERQKEVFSAKRDRMPFLDEDSQSVVIANLGKEFDLESSQSASANGCLPKSAEPAHSDLPNGEQTDGGTRVAQENLDGEESDMVEPDHSPENTNEQHRKISKKLNFDAIIDSTTHPVPDSNLELSEDSTDSSELSTELSADSHTTANDVTKPPRSRRSQKKGTPMKYVAKNRRSSVKSTTNKSLTSEISKEKAADAIMKDVTASQDQSKKNSDTDGASESLDDLVPLREIQDVLLCQPSADESFDEQLPGDATDPVVKTSENVEINENTSATANAMNPIVLQRIAGTPGILKKIDSPSTAEKKFRRVHFGSSFEEPELNSDNSNKTPTIEEPFPASPKGVLKSPGMRRPFANVQPTEEKILITSSPSVDKAESPRNNDEPVSEDEPIFPDLSECQEPIAKIVSRLSITSTNTGSITLRKTLEARGIVEIRHLACMSRREVAGLNIKKPRVETAVKALAQFARDHSPQKQRVVIVPDPGEATTPATVDLVLSEDAAEKAGSVDTEVISQDTPGEEELADAGLLPSNGETQPSLVENSITCDNEETEQSDMTEVEGTNILEREKDDVTMDSSLIEEECASVIDMVTATVSSETTVLPNDEDALIQAQLEARARIPEALERYQEIATKFQHINNEMLTLYEAAGIDAADLEVKNGISMMLAGQIRVMSAYKF